MVLTGVIFLVDISVQELEKYYGAEHILKGLNFEIYRGEKVGLLGRNGAGKTTIFKILSGIEDYDSGNVNVSCRVGILDQIPEYPEKYTVIDVLKTAFDRLYNLKNEMKNLEGLMSQTHDKFLIKKYGILQTEFEAMGGYTINSDIAKVCNGLGIVESMQERLFIQLSGGEKTRVNLGRIILQNPDILLLDEPTNHLDIEMVEWLEDYLIQYKSTVLVISHDRYFLDRIVKRIIEIVDGKAEFYEGNYSYYVKEKEERYLQKLQQYEQKQKKIRQLEEAAKRMHDWARRADNPSLHRRAFSIEKRIEKMGKIQKPFKEKGLSTSFKETKFSSSDVILIKDLFKAYSDRIIVDNLNLIVRRGDRIALIGSNGCGKTTLLKLITAEETPDSGFVRIGVSTNYVFLPQLVTFDEPELSILDTVRYRLEISEEMARNRLAVWHFKGEEVFKHVKDLSGGEKSRLKLCILMDNDINLLILDEPTNHLDIASRQWMEDAIDKFEGTLIFVSHDRYLINKFANRIWDMDGGKITDFTGNYSDYKKWKMKTDILVMPQVIGKVISNKKTNDDMKTISNNLSNNRSRWNPKKERQIAAKMRDLEKDIGLLEEKIRDIEKEMQECASDYKRLQDLMEEKKEITMKLDSCYMEWVEIEG
jgi:ATP-binding cassette subfamily F protein 3